MYSMPALLLTTVRLAFVWFVVLPILHVPVGRPLLLLIRTMLISVTKHKMLRHHFESTALPIIRNDRDDDFIAISLCPLEVALDYHLLTGVGD